LEQHRRLLATAVLGSVMRNITLMRKLQVIIALRAQTKLQRVRVEWRDPGPEKGALHPATCRREDGDRQNRPRECSMPAGASGSPALPVDPDFAAATRSKRAPTTRPSQTALGVGDFAAGPPRRHRPGPEAAGLQLPGAITLASGSAICLRTG
jgi:hypothetical protein